MQNTNPFKEGDKVVRIDALQDTWWVATCREERLDPQGVFTVESAGLNSLRLKGINKSAAYHRFLFAAEQPKFKLGDYVVRTKSPGMRWINACRSYGWAPSGAHRVTGVSSTGRHISINHTLGAQFFAANFELANLDVPLNEVAKEPSLDTSVRQPSHYQVFDGLESIEVIARSMTVSEFRGFCMGNVLKYRLRAGKKSELATVEKDLKKADFYKELFEQHKDKCHD